MTVSTTIESPLSADQQQLAREEAFRQARINGYRFILAPHLLMIACQLPLAAIQYINLWKSSAHYRFFPFLFGAVILLAVTRWPRTGRVFVPSVFANWLLGIGVVFFAAATAFVNPYFASLSVIFTIGSLFARVRDPVSGGRLTPIWLLLFISVQFPLGLDITFITKLQQLSAQCTSLLLDLLGYPHSMPGTILVFPNQSYFVEEACSGVQSLFTLLFCSALYAVWARRGPVHSFLLIGLAVFWSLIMNIMRILLIPIFDVEFGIDLSTGLAHDILGYTILILAVLMIASTDRLLLFILSPVPADPNVFIVRVWHRTVEIVTFAKWRRARKKRREQMLGEESKQTPSQRLPSGPSKATKTVMCTIAGIIAIGAIWQSLDAWRMYRSNVQVAFGLDRIIDLTEEDIPTTIGQWSCVSYDPIERPSTSELGQRSDVWSFTGPTYNSLVSLDQPFAGWHELSTCYRNQGWKFTSEDRTTHQVKMEGSDVEWPYVQVDMISPLGERGFLLFSFIDGYGQPIEPPDDTRPLSFLMQRIRNRLNVRIRKQLFQGEVYQAQLFVQTTTPLTETQRQEAINNYLELRREIRNSIVEATEELEQQSL